MNGRRKAASRFTSRRASGTIGRRRTTALKKMGRRLVSKLPKFATVGYTRNVERKYFDKTWQGNAIEANVGYTGGLVNNGYMWISSTWSSYNFANTTQLPVFVSNDMNKGLETGTTARTRIGNKIKPLYYKGAMTFTAAGVTKATNAQNGEQEAVLASTGVPENVYLRTTWRMVVVKDLQVNSTDTNITWSQVFETNTNLSAGIHSELNVDNMGRFVVLDDKTFELNAQNPQKCITYTFSGKQTGACRYNGPTGTALTDRGIYIIYAAFVSGTGDLNPGGIQLAPPVGHNRLCFQDD